jgi:hypothetical protein
MRALFAAPAGNERSPRYMEKALAAIHQSLRPGQHVWLQYAVEGNRLCLALRFGAQLREVVLGPLLANYPRAKADVRLEEPSVAGQAWHTDVLLTPDLFPILRHSQFEDLLTHSYADPIDGILRALRPDANVHCRLDLIVTPADEDRCKHAKKAIKLVERSFFARRKRLASWYIRRCTSERRSWVASVVSRLAEASTAPERGAPLDVASGYRHEREADLQAAADKLGGHLFSVRLRVTAEGTNESLARTRLHAVVGALGTFTRSRLSTFTVCGTGARRGPSFLLSHEELATLWHPPTVGVEAEGMHVASFTEREAPGVLPPGLDDGEVIVGRTAYRTDERIFGLRREDRRRHVHIIGRTGVGKTTLLMSQLYGDMVRGEGVGLIDPHGDLADTLLRLVPKHRTNDVVLFDAADPEYAFAFNPLACPDPARIDQVTSGVVSALKKLNDSWGPRLENLLRNAVFAVVERQGTLVTLLRLLTDGAFRERFVPAIKDDIVRTFWTTEFAGWNKQYRTEAVAAITNKVQPFLTNTCVRAIVSQAGRTLDLRRTMDEGKILIVNLSKGKIGEDNAALLGSFLVTAIQQAAMTRADMPEDNRRDFYLSIDEFQNFVTTSFETILSEARKYRLNLTVSHQYLAQLPESTAAAIAGNIGTIITFAVGSDDAEWLARAMVMTPGELTPQDFTNLPKFTAYVRLLIDGVPSPPFSMTTLPPPAYTDDRTAVVMQSSRRQFSRPVESVRRQVARDLSVASPFERSSVSPP